MKKYKPKAKSSYSDKLEKNLSDLRNLIKQKEEVLYRLTKNKELKDNIRLLKGKKYPNAAIEIAVQLEKGTFPKTFDVNRSLAISVLENILKGIDACE